MRINAQIERDKIVLIFILLLIVLCTPLVMCVPGFLVLRHPGNLEIMENLENPLNSTRTFSGVIKIHVKNVTDF